MAESVEQLSYDLTASALAEQERAVTALRTRAGTIVAAASIAGSFLGAKTTHGSLDALAIAALIAFVLRIGSAIVVLLPHEFVFAFRGRAVLASSDHGALEDVTDAYRAADIWIQRWLYVNRSKLDGLSNWFTASCVLLAVEVILWTLSLAANLWPWRTRRSNPSRFSRSRRSTSRSIRPKTSRSPRDSASSSTSSRSRRLWRSLNGQSRARRSVAWSPPSLSSQTERVSSPDRPRVKRSSAGDHRSR